MTKRATGNPPRSSATGRSQGRSGAGTRANTRSGSRARSRSGGRSIAPIHLSLDPRQVLWGLGVLLLAIALITLLSLTLGNRGRLTEWWIDALNSVLGWGRYLVPVILTVPSLWLLTQLSGSPLSLPWRRLIGALLVFVALLALTHHLGGVSTDAANAKYSGGWLGALLSGGLRTAFGGAGTVVILLLVVVAGLFVVFDRSLDQLVQDAAGVGARFRAWRGAREPVSGVTPSPAPPRRRRSRTPAATPIDAEPTAPPAEPAATSTRPAVKPQPAQGTSAARGAQDDDLTEVALPQEHGWTLPPVEDMLALDDESPTSLRDIREKTRIIEQTLLSLGVPVSVVEVNPGPVVTQFGLEPGYIERQDRHGKVKRMKVQVAKIASLSNDIALALAAAPIRIEAPVPGKGIVGIEVPNKEMAMVGLRSVMESEEFRHKGQRPLMVAFGRDVSGAPVVDDLASLPHLLIAGATGSGKSVCINALIACLIARNTPETLRLILVDPKRVELSSYNGIPHLITPVVVEANRVVGVLKWLAAEMDRRYELFAQVSARNLEAYNRKVSARGMPPLPNIVMFIDELADLMMVAPDEVERQVCRIAQLSRATGIHLVIATQRPSVDVVTGLIKANFPARVSFLVSSQIDSRVIIDSPGAEKLLGSGDALYMAPDSPKLARIQGCYVSDGELEQITSFWKAQHTMPQESSNIEAADPEKTVQKPLWPNMPGMDVEDDSGNEDEDELLDEAREIVIRQQRASVSLLQRIMRIGYSRAARIIDALEAEGVIGPATGTSKAREVLIAAAEDEDLEPDELDDAEESD
ncbi:MAG: DNA translocase FtsK 4TM domain-containing protein [Anaerolineae bacterium]|jgi:S-DNA-T family DNA segregation ATPase FtsK/SpoIIIE